MLSNGNYGYFYRLANPTGGVYTVTINAAINATQSSLVYDGYSSCKKQGPNTANYTVFQCSCSLAKTKSTCNSLFVVSGGGLFSSNVKANIQAV